MAKTNNLTNDDINGVEWIVSYAFRSRWWESPSKSNARVSDHPMDILCHPGYGTTTAGIWRRIDSPRSHSTHEGPSTLEMDPQRPAFGAKSVTRVSNHPMDILSPPRNGTHPSQPVDCSESSGSQREQNHRSMSIRLMSVPAEHRTTTESMHRRCSAGDAFEYLVRICTF